ncbi:MAG TPA: TolC family protein, partial [Gemmatimonadaceae bacterium]|nr:TolC family protein [Gemmatimonadaceae bacterium]
MPINTLAAACGLALALVPLAVAAQVTPTRGSPPAPPLELRITPDGALDSLVAAATASSPAVRAALARVDAARARVAPAGARPDPMLMAGVQNLPVTAPSFADEMTMKMVGVEQTIPYPGKLGLMTRAAEAEVTAALADLDAARVTVVREIREAYYELAFLNRAVGRAASTQAVLGALIPATEARYAAGTTDQRDVLAARAAATQVAQDAIALAEARRAALARLNAALDRPSETLVEGADIPSGVVRAA